MTDINKKDYASFKKNGTIVEPKRGEAVLIGTTSDSASASNVGATRYRVDGTISYLEQVMQTAASTYEWVEVLRNDWT
jgi:hypothetical protein